MADVVVQIDGQLSPYENVLQCLPPQPKLDYWMLELEKDDKVLRMFIASSIVQSITVIADKEEVDTDDMESTAEQGQMPGVWDNDSLRGEVDELPNV